MQDPIEQGFGLGVSYYILLQHILVHHPALHYITVYVVTVYSFVCLRVSRCQVESSGCLGSSSVTRLGVLRV